MMAAQFQFDRSQWWPAERMRAQQFRQLRLLIAHAIANVPHYRDHLARAGVGTPDDLDPESFLRWPVLGKRELQSGPARFEATSMPAGHGEWRLITTSGSVGVDGSLELFASVPIQKDWVDKTPALQSLAGQQIQIPIRGTIQRPQLDMSSFASIGQQLATSALQGAAQKQIDRGLNKLLGPLSNQLAPIQQGMQQGVQQMQQGVQQNLPQLPLPNLGIPGFGGGAPAVPATAVPGAAAPGVAIPGLPSGLPQPPATTGPPNLPG
jgi:hypothetical protein